MIEKNVTKPSMGESFPGVLSGEQSFLQTHASRRRAIVLGIGGALRVAGVRGSEAAPVGKDSIAAAHEALLTTAPDMFSRMGLSFDLETGIGIRPDLVSILDAEISQSDKEGLLVDAISQTMPEDVGEGYDRNELLFAAVGTVVGLNKIIRDLPRNGHARVGRDMGSMFLIDAAELVFGSETAGERIGHNYREGLASLGKIELVTLLSSKFAQVKGSLPHPYEHDVMSDVEREGEIEDSIHKVAPSLKVTNQAKQEILDHLQGQHDKRKILRDIIYLKEIGDLGSTFLSSAALRPLLLELALNKDGTLDPNMIGALQAWMGDYFGTVSVALPVTLPLLGKDIGGGIGPRTALSLKIGQENLERVDDQLKGVHLLSNLGFIAEVLATMSPEERGGGFVKSYVDFLKNDLADIRWVSDVVNRKLQFELPNRYAEGKAAIETLWPEVFNHVGQTVASLKNLNPAEMGSNLVQLDSQVYEAIRETLGHDMGEILYTLFIQIQSVRHMEVLLPFVLDKIKQSTPMQKLPPAVRENAIDVSTAVLVNGGSAFMDNYVAEILGEGVEEERLLGYVRDGKKGEYSRGVVAPTGELDLPTFRKLHMNLTLQSYLAAITGGAFTVVGNAAHFALASTRERPLEHAYNKDQIAKRSIPAVGAFGIAKAMEAANLLSEIHDERLEEEARAIMA